MRGVGVRSMGFQMTKDLDPNPGSAVHSCVSLGKSRHLSEPHFLGYHMGIIVATS